MQDNAAPFPIHVTFDGLERSTELEESILARAAELSRFHPRIHGVTAVVSLEGRHMTGNHYRVRLIVAVPGHDVVVGDHHRGHGDHEEPFTAVTDAFRAAQRRLEDDGRVRRGLVKSRTEPLQLGRVARLADDGQYSFLETPDGREVYFHRNSADDFEALEVGTPVRFAEEEGEQGPQASAVRLAATPATTDVAVTRSTAGLGHARHAPPATAEGETPPGP